MPRTWTVGIAGLAVLACTGVEPPQSDSLPELPVAVAGCVALSEDGRCLQLPSKQQTIHLWLPGLHDPDLVDVTMIDGELFNPAAFDQVHEHDGVWITIPSPKPGKIQIDHQGHRPFVLVVEEASQLYEETALAGQFDAVLPLDERENFLLECWLSRVQLGAGTLDLPATIDRLRTRAEQVGDTRCFSDFMLILVDAAIAESQLDQAALYLADIRASAPIDLITQINVEYYSAVHAQEMGLRSEARLHFQRALRWAQQVGRAREESSILIAYALLLEWMGRFDEAYQMGKRAMESAPPQTQREVRFSKSWLDVQQRERDPSTPDPIAELRTLVAEYEAPDAADPNRAAIARLNLAVALVQSGQHDLAARELAKVDTTQIEFRQLLYFHLTESRILLEAGNFGPAREKLASAVELAQQILDREFELELLEVRAELEIREGNLQAALAAFQDAEYLADELALEIPANAGRSNFSNTITRSRARHIELALENGDLERALCTAVGARSRHLRTLVSGIDPSDSKYEKALADYSSAVRTLEYMVQNARKLSQHAQKLREPEIEWQRIAVRENRNRVMALRERHNLPTWRCSSVRPADANVALLVGYPSSDQKHWRFMLDRATQIHVHAVPNEGGPENVATQAIEHFASQGKIEGAHTLVVVPLGDLLTVNFQMLEFLDQPDAPRVHHGLGLGFDFPSESGDHAAVIGNAPDLPELDDELQDVRQALESQSWTLSGQWDFTAPEEHQPRLLHYGGHAKHAGLSGWDSYLELPGGALTVEELLLNRRAPQLVVLSACSTGAVDVSVLDGGMNVATAMLLSGAQLVIAADRDVDDQEARALAQALYRALPKRELVDADAMVTALTDIQRENDQFRAWRAWVP